jgi:hypothetical protein
MKIASRPISQKLRELAMNVERFGLSTIDLFKCDIEGAERKLFSAGSDEWIHLNRVSRDGRNLAPRLHISPVSGFVVPDSI